MTIHEHIKEKTGLATFYAEDGGFLNAARVLKQLAEDLEAHHEATAPRVPYAT